MTVALYINHGYLILNIILEQKYLDIYNSYLKKAAYHKCTQHFIQLLTTLHIATLQIANCCILSDDRHADWQIDKKDTYVCMNICTYILASPLTGII